MTRFTHKNQLLTAIAVLVAVAIALTACGALGSGGSSDTNALRDTAWELVSLGGSELIPGTTITLRFAAPGAPETGISGRAGCNTYGGGYKATRESLTFSGVYATEMACMDPAGVMEQERAYLDALYAAASYQVVPDGGGGDRLELYDGDGALLMVFVPEGIASAQATIVAAATPTAVPPTAMPTVVPPTATRTPEPPTLAPEPPAGYSEYVDPASGVSLWLPEGWLAVAPVPEPPPDQSRTTILQSYPLDEYVGGEPFRPGDSKCDLTTYPAGVRAADVLARTRSGPRLTVLTQQEIVLNSGRVGVRREIESMGRSLSMVVEVGERAVTLTCFGELAPFDEIAVTLGAQSAGEDG